MSASPARRLAVRALGEVRRREAYAHEVVSALLDEAGLSGADRSFATRMAYGAIASCGTLDEVLSRYVRKPNSLEPRVADALRLAAYEILFLDTPPHAAVSQGVELVREAAPRAAGLANAVLRRLAAEADDFPFDDVEGTGALARRTAHPLWMAELLVRDLGEDAAARVLEADNEPAPLYLAQTAFSEMSVEELGDSLGSAGAAVESCPVAGCLQVSPPAMAVSLPAVRDRSVLVMDAGAQLVASLVPVRPGCTLLDVGAGRGSKSLVLQSRALRAGGACAVHAIDKDAHKLAILEKDAERSGAPGIRTHAIDMLLADPSDLVRDLGGADAALVDAPCSGLGTLRRHPDKRWRLRESDIADLAALGAGLLARTAALVNVGGSIVYATCTLSKAENEDVITAFLASEVGAGYRVDAIEGEIPADYAHFVTPEGFLRTLPAPGGPDGHFAARLVRII